MITPETAEIIKAAIDDDRIDLHTALPGKVQAVYPAVAGVRDLGVDVVLEVKRALPKADGTYTTEDLPVLKNIPVAFPGSNDFMLAFALAKDDQGMVLFNETSIDQWRSKGSNTSPGDIGRHTLTGGVFYPGLKSVLNALTDVLTDGLLLGKKTGYQVRVNSTGAEVTTGGAPASIGGFVAMATGLYNWILAVDTIIRTAWVVAPTDGGAALKAAWLAELPTPPSLAEFSSTNLKAD